MKIYRYWVKIRKQLNLGVNQPQETVIYGKSNLSEQDAKQNAEEQFRIIQDRINHNEYFSDANDYEVTIKEPMLEEIAPGNIITRNYYGAEILNTETLIIADIDAHDFRSRYVPGFFGRLFGKKEESQIEYESRLTENVLQSLKTEWKEKSHIRVYRTHSGFRIIFSGLDMDTGSRECSKLLNSMKSDWLYVRLCEKQRCCRARLTPKPARIKQKTLRLRFPYEQEDLEKINDWIREYNEKSKAFAVCKLIKTYGRRPTEADSPVIYYHDKKCGIESNFPLA